MQKGNALKALNIIHKVLMMGQVLFASVFMYLIYSNTVLPMGENLDKILQVAALVIAFAGIFAGMALFKKKLMQIREMQAGEKKNLVCTGLHALYNGH